MLLLLVFFIEQVESTIKHIEVDFQVEKRMRLKIMLLKKLQQTVIAGNY